MNKRLFKKAFINTLPVMAGYLVLGTGFGILMRMHSFGVLWALSMSLFIYAGSMQFVGISLIASGASFISIALTTLMVNARHIFYGISAINKYKGMGAKKPYLIHSLTDETYSLVCGKELPEGTEPHSYYLTVSLLDHSYWVLGTLAGSLIGSLITFSTAGIDFSMTALFVTIFVEQWLSSREHRPALFGLTSTVVCLIIFGKDAFLMPAMLCILALLTISRRFLDKEDEEK